MTYSIVARDKKTGQLWVAVQTHWFGVGNNVPWLEAGVWAVATQAQTNMDYWKIGLQLMKSGKSIQEVFDIISQDDDALHVRQVAMIDAQGNVFAHTWEWCLKYADYIIWDDFIVQGNTLTNENVVPAMKEAYEKNIHKDFAERLYLCIQAWEDAWWELRWVQSAALRIVSSVQDEHDIMNLRIDDHLEPLQELKRQLNIQKAYNLVIQAEEAGFTGTIEESLQLFDKAFQIDPDNEEFMFWEAFMFQHNGKREEAEEIFKRFPKNSKWSELRKRIS